MLSIALAMAFGSQPVPDEPKFSMYAEVRSVNKSGSKTYDDVVSHIPTHSRWLADNTLANMLVGNKLSSNGHEVCHGVSANVRNEWASREGKDSSGWQGIYCLDHRAVVLKQPTVDRDDVIAAMPPGFRGRDFTFNVYFRSYDNSVRRRCLYVFDEWNAYVTGALISNESNDDQVSHNAQCVAEFALYGLAVCKVMPLDRDVQTFTRWQLKRSMDIVDKDTRAKRYWESFLSSADAAGFRKFTSDYCGADWCRVYLNFRE